MARIDAEVCVNHDAPAPVDLTSCDREPIHVPGSIQPHGVLLCVREPDLVVTNVSANIAASLGRGAAAVVGAPLSDLLDAASLACVRSALAERRPAQRNPLPVVASNGARFDGIVHRHLGATILELERTQTPDDEPAGHVTLRTALADLQLASTVLELSTSVVETVRRLTGFDRVMVYRFDEDGHGSVVAESKKDGCEPYLGLHYPASDIPAQARQLYLQNWLRIIPDARYTPSPIVPATRPDAGGPLDLSFSVLRSVSPIHLEYLANMGVRASMSISLVVRDRLWGLVACLHHSEPRFVPYETRSVCEAIARLVSLQIGALEERERAALRDARRTSVETLADAMAQASQDDDVLTSLLSRADVLLGLVDADGAAVVCGSTVQKFGRVPSEEIVLGIADWLGSRGERAPFETSSLAAAFAAAATAKDVASGVLTVALPGSPRRRVIWFRPEMIHAVKWGGDPRKPALGDAHARLHPRRSFEMWKEEVRLRSRPWTPTDVVIVEELRRRAIEIDLTRQLARANRAVRARDDLVAIVSHDLRNPLSAIQMQTALLLRSSETTEDESAQRLHRSMERIQRAIDRMGALITDLLDLAKIEDGRFELSPRPEHVRDVIDESLLVVRPLAEAKRIKLREDLAASALASVDRERLFQVLSNILGNAIKFTREGGTIEVRTNREGDELSVSIADEGPGIPEEAMKHVFDRYWQAPGSRRATGSGLGLYIAKGIVEAHGGRIWVERAPSGGAKFAFTIPCAAQ
jgi:two-component system, chemotaxis family, sensor kinase Cph1